MSSNSLHLKTCSWEASFTPSVAKPSESQHAPPPEWRKGQLREQPSRRQLGVIRHKRVLKGGNRWNT
eukprot:2951931-Amphidinium_carterae.2